MVIPKRNLRTEVTGEKKTTIFDQVSFHATPFSWIALAYLYRETPGYGMGVNLYGSESEVYISGPETLKDSLRVLYESGGYLHHFDAADFWWCDGLGNREVITNKPISPLLVEFISDPVAAMTQEGVTFLFTKQKPQT